MLVYILCFIVYSSYDAKLKPYDKNSKFREDPLIRIYYANDSERHVAYEQLQLKRKLLIINMASQHQHLPKKVPKFK